MCGPIRVELYISNNEVEVAGSNPVSTTFNFFGEPKESCARKSSGIEPEFAAVETEDGPRWVQV